jgi:hypothetical protein
MRATTTGLFKMTKWRLFLDAILIAIIVAIFAVLAGVMWMPGNSYHGRQQALTSAERSIESDLRAHIKMLAGIIGERNSAKYDNLNLALAYIEKTLEHQGYRVAEQEYKLEDYSYKNIESQITGSEKPSEIVIIGAHYDSVTGCPGANDNGSGTATVLELAKLMAHHKPKRTVRFVLFTNEEPPYFGGEEMGSYQYAQRCKRRNENIVAMLDVETLGYYTDAPHTQTYPSHFTPFYPNTGNFITFVSNVHSRPLAEACIGTFRDTTKVPSEGVAAPEWINGVDWADHKWFWADGYAALMITDTAPYRYPQYHTAQDTPDKLNYPVFARVVAGLHRVLLHLSDDWHAGKDAL